MLLGPQGQIWLPIHALLPYARYVEGVEAVRTIERDLAAEFERHGIRISILTLSCGPTLLFEPAVYWLDELGDFRLDRISPEGAARWRTIPANPEARKVALEARRRLVAATDALGGVHFQVGRYYAYESRLEAPAADLLRGLRGLLDPEGIVNPGVLGA